MTAKSLAFGIAACVIITVLHSYANWLGHNGDIGINDGMVWPSAITGPIGDATACWGMALGLAVVMRILPKKSRLNSAELVFVFTCIMMAPILTSGAGPAGNRWIVAPANHYFRYLPAGNLKSEYVEWYLSTALFPKEPSVLEGMQEGGAMVPWADWTVVLINQLIFFLVVRLFFFFGTALIQEQYVDVEALAFPVANITKNTLDLTAPQEAEEDKGLFAERGSHFRNLFLAAFAVYFVWSIISSNVGGKNLNIWIPGLTGVTLSYDFTPYDWIKAPLMVDLTLDLFPVFLIMPMSTVVTVPIVQIIMYMILPPILIAAGEVVDWSPGQSASRLQSRTIGAMYQADTHTAYGYWSFYLGIVFGLAFVPLLFQRSLIVNSIKKALSGEDGSWISMRLLWGGWGLTALVTIVMFSYMTGAPIYIPIVWLVLLGGIYMGMARYAVASGANATTAYSIEQNGEYANFLIHWENGGGSALQNAYTYNSLVLGNILTGGRGQGFFPSNPMLYHLESFKLAQLTKADRKQMTTAMLIGSLLPVIIGMPITLYFGYQIGWARAHTYNTHRSFQHAYIYMEQQQFYLRTVTPGRGTFNRWSHFWEIPLGIVFVFLLTLARRRFGGPMNYIDPYGFLLVWLFGHSYWIPCIIVAIIRFTVYKTGGTEMYQKWIYPIALGMLVCSGLIWMIEGTLWVYYATAPTA